MKNWIIEIDKILKYKKYRNSDSGFRPSKKAVDGAKNFIRVIRKCDYLEIESVTQSYDTEGIEIIINDGERKQKWDFCQNGNILVLVNPNIPENRHDDSFSSWQEFIDNQILDYVEGI